MVQLRLENLLTTDALHSALDSEPWEKQEDPRVRWDGGSGSEKEPTEARLPGGGPDHTQDHKQGRQYSSLHRQGPEP